MAGKIQPAFWLANAQEACERLAYFGIRAVLPAMMVSVGTGGLGLSMKEKGVIFGIWALIQCMVPMVSGGFSESFGYKKSLITAFIINAFGYILMANIIPISSAITGADDLQSLAGWNFVLMMIAGCIIGMGTAIFKPPVQGIVARSLDEKSSGFGFGLFYWVVNIGGFFAPIIASALRGSDAAPTWQNVFYGAAIVTFFNLLLTIILFKEPKRTEAEESKNAKDSPEKVFINTLKILINDKKILGFLLIVSGFWLMFMQLWDLLPNFINDWIDRRAVGEWLSQYPIFESFLESDKSLKFEMIINIDSFTIIALVLPLSWVFSHCKMITSLVVGMVISVIGFVMTGMTTSGYICCLAVFVFAIGEIICSPKFNEYIGMSAPADKKAIYMGFSNMPFAIGWAVGNFLSGPIYDLFASKKLIGIDWLNAHNLTTYSYQALSLSGTKSYLADNNYDGDFPEKLDSLKEWLVNSQGVDPEIASHTHVDDLSFSQMYDFVTQGCDKADLACQTLSLQDQIISSGISLEPEAGLTGAINNMIQSVMEMFGFAADKSMEIMAALVDRSLGYEQLMATRQLVIANHLPAEVDLSYFSTDVIQNLVMEMATKLNGSTVDAYAATELLWDSATPWMLWIILGAVGLASMIGMIVFYFKSGMHEKDVAEKEKKSKKEAVEVEDSDAAAKDDNSDAAAKDDNSDAAAKGEDSDAASTDDKSDAAAKGEDSNDHKITTDDVENITIKD